MHRGSLTGKGFLKAIDVTTTYDLGERGKKSESSWFLNFGILEINE